MVLQYPIPAKNLLELQWFYNFQLKQEKKEYSTQITMKLHFPIPAKKMKKFYSNYTGFTLSNFNNIQKYNILLQLHNFYKNKFYT